MIAFFVNGTPKGQPRPKAFARKMANGKFMARVYDPGTAEGWKSEVAIAARPHIPAQPISGPLRLELTFYFPRPKAHFLKSGLRENAPTFHTSKPDRDNCEKAVLDAMTCLGFWKDDAQVCAGATAKVYVDERNQPGCSVRITELLDL